MANARLGWFSPLGLAASIRVAVRRVGLRAHCFRFSARTASELPLGEFVLSLGGLAFGLTAPEIAARRVGLRVHCFRFSARTASEIALGGLVLPPSASEIAAGRVDSSARWLAFGFTASAFRHAPLRSGRWADWPSGSPLPLFGTHRFGVAAGRVGLRAHRFGDCRSAGWPSGSPLPLFGMHRFGNCPRRVGSSVRRVGLRAHCFRFSARADSEWPLGGWPSGLLLRRLPFGGLAFGLTASAFRHAPLRSGRWASSFFRLPFWRFRSAGWPSGSPLPLFGTRRSAPPHRRSEDRRSTPTRQLFHFKTLIPTC